MRKGIDANRDTIAGILKNSLMLVTALNRHIGYDAAVGQIFEDPGTYRIRVAPLAMEATTVGGEVHRLLPHEQIPMIADRHGRRPRRGGGSRAPLRPPRARCRNLTTPL